MVRLSTEVHEKLGKIRLDQESFSRAIDRLMQLHSRDQEDRSETAR